MNLKPKTLSFNNSHGNTLNQSEVFSASQFTTIHLYPLSHQVEIKCDLPSDASVGDTLEVIAENHEQGEGKLFTSRELSAKDIDKSIVKLTLSGTAAKGNYWLYLNLRGHGESIKNSAEYNVQLFASMKAQSKTNQTKASWFGGLSKSVNKVLAAF